MHALKVDADINLCLVGFLKNDDSLLKVVKYGQLHWENIMILKLFFSSLRNGSRLLHSFTPIMRSFFWVHDSNLLQYLRE